MRPWFYALGDRGPDWHFSAEARPGDATRLRALVRGLALPGFRRYEARALPGAFTASVGDHDWYVDARNFDALVGNLGSAPTTNLYVYHLIAIEAGTVGIRRGYAGYDGAEPGEPSASEGRVVEAVAGEGEIALVRWSVGAGGDGYPHETIANGEGAASLRAYLGGPAAGGR